LLVVIDKELLCTFTWRILSGHASSHHWLRTHIVEYIRVQLLNYEIRLCFTLQESEICLLKLISTSNDVLNPWQCLLLSSFEFRSCRGYVETSHCCANFAIPNDELF
jgi:hypothetical protein